MTVTWQKSRFDLNDPCMMWYWDLGIHSKVRHLTSRVNHVACCSQLNHTEVFFLFFYGNAWLLLLEHFLGCVWNLKLGATKVPDLQLAAARLINSEMHKSVSRGDSLYLHPTYTFSWLCFSSAPRIDAAFGGLLSISPENGVKNTFNTQGWWAVSLF